MKARFCAVAYNPDDLRRTECTVSDLILIFSAEDDGRSEVRVHPDWAELVSPCDIAYFQSLLPDLKVRADQDSEGLFKQLSSLGVGPLVTLVTGCDMRSDPALWDLFQSFLPI